MSYILGSTLVGLAFMALGLPVYTRSMRDLRELNENDRRLDEEKRMRESGLGLD